MKKRADRRLIELYEKSIEGALDDLSTNIYIRFQKKLKILDRFPLEEWAGARKSLFDYCNKQLRDYEVKAPLLKYILAQWASEYYREEYEEWMEWE